MQIFKAFFKVLKKSIPSSLIYIIIFLSISLVFAFSGQEDKTVFEQTELIFCIFDQDDSAESRSLVSYIGKQHELVDLEQDEDILLDALYYERVNCILLIKSGYAKQLAAGNTENLFERYTMHAGYADILTEQLLDQYVASVSAYLAEGCLLPEAVQKAETALSVQADVTYADFEADTEYPTVLFFFFQYLPYILISVLFNTLCPVLLTMNRNDIRFRTDCSGIRPASYLLWNSAGSVLFIIGIWLLFMGVGMILYGGLYVGKAWIAALNSFVFTLVSASWAILFSCFSPGENTINLITQVIGLGMSFFCGIFVEQSLLGSGVLAVARFLPAYWYVRINNMLSGNEPFRSENVLVFLLIETAFAVVAGMLALLIGKFRYRRLSAE